MKYHELTLNSHKNAKRVGRGIAGGQGKTAGRGTKGQRARAGSGRKPGFEGGQNPMIQRLPKLRGFTSHRPTVVNVYTGQLDHLGATINNQTLADAGLVPSPYVSVKLIVKGEVTKKHTVELQKASEAAVAMLEKTGGSFKAIERVGRPKTRKVKDSKESAAKSAK